MFLVQILAKVFAYSLDVTHFFEKFPFIPSQSKPKANEKRAWQMRMKPCLPFRYNILFTECASIVVKNKNAAVLIKCLPSYEMERNEPSPLCARWKSCFNFHFLYLIKVRVTLDGGQTGELCAVTHIAVESCYEMPFYHRRGLSQRKERRITE